MSPHRIVVKIGTNVLTREDGQLDLERIAGLVSEVSRLKQEDREIILVSSGAVGAGKSVLQLPEKLNPVTKRQVYASVGQVELMKLYTELFRNHGFHCAQVLATKEDFRDRTHFVNMKRCMLALLRDNIVPIINENDVISIDELMFTDNDELAALTASLVNADALVILSNVDGVLDERGAVIPVIRAEDISVFDKIMPGTSRLGRGGMRTKLRMCQQTARLGIHTYIANGKRQTLEAIVRGEAVICSYFPAGKKRSGLKRWMAHSNGMAEGRIVVNQGAADILRDKTKAASLLPVGVTSIGAPFKKGETVTILTEAGETIGIGIAAYGSKKLETLIGIQGARELIHYDYLLVY